MLVSSIGYFNPLQNMVHRDYVVNSKSAKVNLNEGFGNINETQYPPKSNMLINFIEDCKDLFTQQKTDESRKYLSLIG
jgi:hypothetical protein